MTDEATPNLPVSWEQELAKDARAVAKLERAMLSQISLRAGVMMLQKMPVPDNKLQCVIVASAFQNRYYTEAFDADTPKNPDCFSLSLDGKNMVPHDASPNKQSNTCESCEQFKWASAEKGRGKACKSTRRLVVLPAKSVIEGGARKAEMAMLTVPVTSIKNWAAFVNGAAAEYRRPPWGLLTQIHVVPDPKTQFQVKFEAVGLVDESALGDVHSRIPAAIEFLMAPYDASGDSTEKEPVKTSKKY